MSKVKKQPVSSQKKTKQNKKLPFKLSGSGKLDVKGLIDVMELAIQVKTNYS